MIGKFTKEESQYLSRVSDEPWLWLRNNFPEAKEWEDELFDLIDHIKNAFDETRKFRITICFAVELTLEDNNNYDLHIDDYGELIKIENASNSTTIFVINLRGKVVGKLRTEKEILPNDAAHISQIRELLIFWLNTKIEIYCKGFPWNPRNRQAVQKEIKSKQRTTLLSMDDYEKVLDTNLTKENPPAG